MANQFLGNLVDTLGTAFNLPEMGWSENIGGGPTSFTGITPQSIAGGQQRQSSTNYGPFPYEIRNQNNQNNRIATTPNGTGSPVQQTNPNPVNDIPAYISSLENQLYGQMNSQADQMIAGLDPQRQAQEQIVGNTYNQGINDLQANRSQGFLDLGTQEQKTEENQVKTLNDLNANLRNMFQAGQVYLGARGAGDSSAANQYSYALTKMGNENRGNILSQTNSIYNDINDRRSRLQNIYTQESSRLATDKSNQLLGIAQWFANAQNQIKQTKSSNSIALGQQVLNQAIAYLGQIDQSNRAQNNALQTWAMNNAKNIQQLGQNMQGISAYQAPTINSQTLPGLNNGAVGNNGQYYPGSNSTTDENLFGQ